MIGRTETDISVMYERIHEDWRTDERARCIRSHGCQWSRRMVKTGGEQSVWTCDDCIGVLSYRSFTRQLARTSIAVHGLTNSKYLSRTQLLALRSTSTTRTKHLSRRVTRLSVQLAQARLRLRDALAQVRSDIERGDVVAVSHRLRSLHREGAFADAPPQLQLALDGLTALCSPQRGARRTAITKDVMVALHVEFGPACAKFVHANLGLGGGTSVERWLRADRRPFAMGIHEDNFREGAEVMAASMRRLNITGPILHQTAEDETAIQDSVSYHPQSDSLVGFCGPVCAQGHHLVTKCRCPDRHACCVDGDGSIVLGPSPDGDASVYNRIENSFSTQKVATLGRCVVLVPLHEDLHATVLMWAPCCGAMTADDYIRYQWTEIDRLLVKYFEPIQVFQLGKASDGAHATMSANGTDSPCLASRSLESSSAGTSDSSDCCTSTTRTTCTVGKR
jgi:hypothetical protein